MVKREYLVGFVAACVLAVVLSFTGSSQDPVPVASGSATPAPSAAQATDPSSPSMPLKRDPFFGTVFAAEEAQANALSLEGIIWDDASPLAVINGEVVAPGARVAEYLVVSIHKNSVTLSADKKTIDLAL